MGINIYAVTFLISILLLIALIYVGRKQNITFYIMNRTVKNVSTIPGYGRGIPYRRSNQTNYQLI